MNKLECVVYGRKKRRAVACVHGALQDDDFTHYNASILELTRSLFCALTGRTKKSHNCFINSISLRWSANGHCGYQRQPKDRCRRIPLRLAHEAPREARKRSRGRPRMATALPIMSDTPHLPLTALRQRPGDQVL